MSQSQGLCSNVLSLAHSNDLLIFCEAFTPFVNEPRFGHLELSSLHSVRKRTQFRPIYPQEGPKATQDGPRRPKTAPRRPVTAPRLPQDCLKTAPRRPKTAPSPTFPFVFVSFLRCRLFHGNCAYGRQRRTLVLLGGLSGYLFGDHVRIGACLGVLRPPCPPFLGLSFELFSR